jgi:acetyl esterase
LDRDIARTMALLPDLDFAQPVEVRTRMARFIQLLAAAGLRVMEDPSVDVRDATIPSGPRVRIYRPRLGRERPSAIVYYHGGAFVLGDLEFEHPRCLEMARQTGSVVISVDYRLAPEYPFPAGFEDCWTALQWVFQNGDLGIDTQRVAVAGASAGGALAAAVCLKARDHGGPHPCFQLLIYPVIDDRMNTQSMMDFATIPGWNRVRSEYMWLHYLGKDRCCVSPYAAPARADEVRGLPSAYIMTAELDALRDEGICYAHRLIAAGVPTELHHYPGAFHGFDTLSRAELSRRACNEQYAALREALRPAN